MLQDRVTAGVSYVVPANLALPHITIRPPYPEAADGPTIHRLASVLQNEVCPWYHLAACKLALPFVHVQHHPSRTVIGLKIYVRWIYLAGVTGDTWCGHASSLRRLHQGLPVAPRAEGGPGRSEQHTF